MVPKNHNIVIPINIQEANLTIIYNSYVTSTQKKLHGTILRSGMEFIGLDYLDLFGDIRIDTYSSGTEVELMLNENFDNFSVLCTLCCDWLWGGQLNHIGLCIWVKVLFTLSRASVRPPFPHQGPSKNEVTAVPIYPNKSTQNRLRPVYRPCQKSTHISPIIELYVRQVRHFKLPLCWLDNSKEAESTLPQLFSSRH